jgi:hypothetical protein
MAATPKRASNAEAALLKDGFEAARAALPRTSSRSTTGAAPRLSPAGRDQPAAPLELRLAEPQRPVEVEAL